LPASLIKLMGREDSLAYICDALTQPDTRLLTLTGSPGVGKTQLALAAAHQVSQQGQFAQGCYFVALAPFNKVEDVPSAILGALGAGLTEDISWDAVRRLLQPRRTLLVLDNLEQLLPVAQELAETLRTCPQLTLLVTSRIRLRITGEREYPVKPLSHEAAQQLFVTRAQAVQPSFAVTERNAADIAAICKRLDMLPLAIELAAARIKLLAPAALLARLNSRFTLLTDGATDAPERHQTLRNAISWSYELLTAEEQRTFDSLGVFAESWSLAGVQKVAQLNEEAALAHMTALINHSLIAPLEGDEDADEPRFTMLESLREFARERLNVSALRDDVRAHHAEFFHQLALKIEPPLREGKDDAYWLGKLEREHDNLRNALEWLLTHQQPSAAAETGHALWVFWCMRGHAREGLTWMERTLAQMPSADDKANAVTALARAKALRAAGSVCYQLFELNRAIRFFEESLEMARRADDAPMLQVALANLATATYSHGNTARAKSLIQELLRLDEQGNDERSMASSWMTLGEIALAEQAHDEAIVYLQQALTVWRRTGERHNIAIVLTNLGISLLRKQDWAAAGQCQHEALVLARELGDEQLECVVLNNITDLKLSQSDVAGAQANCLLALRLAHKLGSFRDLAIQFDSLALCALHLHLHERAFTLLGASDGIRQGHAVTPTAYEKAAREEATRGLYALLSENDPRHNYAYTRGKVLTLEQAVVFAMG
jgi:predicted ATPase